jgi:hypothetical protein
MFFDNSYFTVAIYLAVIVAVVVAIHHWHQSAAVDSHVQRMMVSCGIREKTAANADQLLDLRYGRSSLALPKLPGRRSVRPLARRGNRHKQQFLSECLAFQEGSGLTKISLFDCEFPK